MLWRDPHAGGFLHHGNAQDGTKFIAQPRTPNQQQSHLVLVEIGTNVQDWLVHVSRPLPKTLSGKQRP